MIQASAYYSRRLEPDETAALPLVRRRSPRPRPLIVDKHALGRMHGRGGNKSSRVPRLSTLVRANAAQSAALRRARRLGCVVAMVCFAAGCAASPDLRATFARDVPLVSSWIGELLP